MTGIYDLSVLKRHAFLLSYGKTALGPLASAPEMESDTRTCDCLLYQDGKAAAASFLEKNEVRVTVVLKDADNSLLMLRRFRPWMDLLEVTAGAALTFTPATADGVQAKTLTFPHAVLLPEWRFAPESGVDHAVRLVFRCVADADGNLFTWQ